MAAPAGNVRSGGSSGAWHRPWGPSWAAAPAFGRPALAFGLPACVVSRSARSPVAPSYPSPGRRSGRRAAPARPVACAGSAARNGQALGRKARALRVIDAMLTAPRCGARAVVLPGYQHRQDAANDSEARPSCALRTSGRSGPNRPSRAQRLGARAVATPPGGRRRAGWPGSLIAGAGSSRQADGLLPACVPASEPDFRVPFAKAGGSTSLVLPYPAGRLERGLQDNKQKQFELLLESLNKRV